MKRLGLILANWFFILTMPAWILPLVFSVAIGEVVKKKARPDILPLLAGSKFLFG